MASSDFSIHDRTPPPPPDHKGWGTGTALLLLVLAVGLLLVPLPRTERVVSALTDLGHLVLGAVLVAALTALLARGASLPVGAAALLAFLLAVLLQVALEVVQPLFGRTTSMEDALAGTAGAAAAMCWTLARRPQAAFGWLFTLLGLGLLAFGGRLGAMDLLDALGQGRELPVLSGFESGLEMRRWRFEGTEPRRVQRHATEGAWSLEVPIEAGRMPTLDLVWPVRDWRGWDGVAFDVRSDGAGLLGVVVEVRDDESDDATSSRYEGEFRLDPSGASVEIPLADVAGGPAARRLDLGRIDSLRLRIDGTSAQRTVHLDNVRLVRTPR